MPNPGWRWLMIETAEVQGRAQTQHQAEGLVLAPGELCGWRPSRPGEGPWGPALEHWLDGAQASRLRCGCCSGHRPRRAKVAAGQTQGSVSDWRPVAVMAAAVNDYCLDSMRQRRCWNRPVHLAVPRALYQR